MKENEYVILRYLHEGDFFGEVTALTVMSRTANVIPEEESGADAVWPGCDLVPSTPIQNIQMMVGVH